MLSGYEDDRISCDHDRRRRSHSRLRFASEVGEEAWIADRKRSRYFVCRVGMNHGKGAMITRDVTIIAGRVIVAGQETR